MNHKYCFQSNNITTQLKKLPPQEGMTDVLVPVTLPGPSPDGKIVLQVTGYAPWVGWLRHNEQHMFVDANPDSLDLEDPSTQQLLLRGTKFLTCLVCNLVLPKCILIDSSLHVCPTHQQTTHIAEWKQVTDHQIEETMREANCLAKE